MQLVARDQANLEAGIDLLLAVRALAQADGRLTTDEARVIALAHTLVRELGTTATYREVVRALERTHSLPVRLAHDWPAVAAVCDDLGPLATALADRLVAAVERAAAVDGAGSVAA